MELVCFTPKPEKNPGAGADAMCQKPTLRGDQAVVHREFAHTAGPRRAIVCRLEI